jgi:phosphatidylglycerol:prolipoprotein diacylglycerol transferase
MYPNLYYFFRDVFGGAPEILRAVQSFGFFVAISFILAAYFFSKELKRKERQGLIHSWLEPVKKGQPLSPADYILSAIIGFVIGYKLLFIVLNFHAFTQNTQSFILSMKGNILGGLLGAAISCWVKYSDKKKELQKHPQPVMVNETMHPFQAVGNMTLIAAVAGLLGAKIFHNLENWNDFKRDPIDALLSFSGLTMYGGLILGSAAVIWYARKKKITIPHLIDACAPALMLAYGVGRLGCQVAGDGDWGIPNSAYVTDINGTLQAAQPPDFDRVLQEHSTYFARNFGSTEKVHHIYAPAPSWLPRWTYAMNYTHNVNREGVDISNCTWDEYCTSLPTAVFPTPFYESVMCIGLFFVLWGLRKKIVVPGVLFSVYLVLNGVERFFIEQIRVNTTLFMIGDYKVTQAMFIAVILILIGIGGIMYFRNRHARIRIRS